MFAAWLKNQSISRKFALSLAIFLVAPLIALGLFVNLPLAQRMDRQNCQTNLEILKQTATPIEYMIEDVLYISLEVIGHDGLQAYLKSGGTENDRLSIQYDINRLLTSREYITRLSVYRREGIAIQFGAYLPAESDGRFEQLDALGGRYMWTCAALEEGYLSRGDRRYEVSMLRAVNDLDVYGRVLGYERINVSEDCLCSLYSGIASDSTLDIFILDAQGRVVSAMDKSRLGGEVELDVVKGAEGFALGGEDKLLSWYSIPGVGWRVVKLDRASAILDRRLANLVLGFAIALTLFFGLCFYFVQRRSVIRPVRLLLSDVENVCDGQYDVSLHTASRDEIGQLNRGIMDMTERLRDLIERVYKLRIRQQEAQLKALSMQINPHFLYNTLDTLRFTALRRGEKDIARYSSFSPRLKPQTNFTTTYGCCLPVSLGKTTPTPGTSRGSANTSSPA